MRRVLLVLVGLLVLVNCKSSFLNNSQDMFKEIPLERIPDEVIMLGKEVMRNEKGLDDDKYIGIVKAQVQSDFKHHPFDWPYSIYMKYDDKIYRLTIVLRNNTVMDLQEVPEEQLDSMVME